MAGYQPLKITGMKTGLVQEREEFILPNDAYPTLVNAFVWRERIKRKQGYELLGRLQKVYTNATFFTIPGSPWAVSLFIQTGYITAANNSNPGQITTSYPHGLINGNGVRISGVSGATGYNAQFNSITVVDEFNFTIGADAGGFGAYVSGGFYFSNQPLVGAPNAEAVPGSFSIVIGAITYTDQGDGTITSVTPGNSGTINYLTGAVSITSTAPPGTASTISYKYALGLPVMGLRSRELNNISSDQTIAFDETYAYRFNTSLTPPGWQEFIPGTIWTGGNSDFFWSTNYWIDGIASNRKIFWVTNDSGTTGDPIRYTNGSAWADFAPQINASADLLTQCVAMLPFRGRLLAFNTLEGQSLGASVNYPQRIRWSALGTPFTSTSSVVIDSTNTEANAWKDDIRGKGGYLDLPTSQNIVAVGFVRDNLVIYCQNSTWQLRYTGRSFSPFQEEQVNSELGAESTFSGVQFDTSLVGIGDKGVVECDSYKSNLIDVKIPDLVFGFNTTGTNSARVHGIRDFVQRLAYWTYPFQSEQGVSVTFPNRRLVYNYENDSWAIFTDSLTCLGTFQPQTGRTWASANIPWAQANYTWLNQPALIPDIVGGNQQGYVEYLDSKVSNDVSLSISGIQGNTTTPTVITCINHNMQTGAVISIHNIPIGTPFASSLNDAKFSVVVVTLNTFQLWKYNSNTQQFSDPQLDVPGTYIGGGQIAIRDNFSVVSKKFNFMDEGQNIQMGYIDVLMNDTVSGAISCNVYLDYNTSTAINVLPENVVPATGLPDSFFNTVVPTSSSGGIEGAKNWTRVFCPARGAFLTIEWTLSNAQLVGVEQESDVQIDAQVLWIRKGGRLQSGGV